MDSHINKVTVLLSSYNGERYISEQIDSILTQKDVNVNLIIRDDGSKDKTKTIIETFCKEHSNILFVNGENIGFINSFSELIDIALSQSNDDSYYAFADQDDIWLSDKLSSACKNLNNMDQAKPCLYCCNSYLMNKDGNVYGKFHPKPLNITKGNIIIYPPFQGCSMVFNLRAAQAYNKDEPTFTYHDLWMYFICHFMGEIYVDNEPRFKYRIHGDNVHGIGIKNKNGINEFIYRFNRFLFDRHISEDYKTAQYFYSVFQKILPESSKTVLLKYLGYRKSIYNKIRFIFDEEFIPTDSSLSIRFLEIIHILQGRV